MSLSTRKGMDRREKERLRKLGLDPQKDGSYHFRYRGQTYALRVRRDVDTDTWDVVSVWSAAAQRYLPLRRRQPEDRWEALLANELCRSLQEAHHAAEQEIQAWLDQGVRVRRSRSA